MWIGILASVAAGATLVANRMANARLGERVGVEQSTLTNYVTGLLGALLLCAFAGEWGLLPGAPWYAFLGGAIGVFVVCLTSWITPRMSVVKATAILFASQMAASLLFEFSLAKLAGCVLVALGATLFESDKNEAAPETTAEQK